MFKDELEKLLNDKMPAYSLMEYLNNQEFETELLAWTKKSFEEIKDCLYPFPEDKDKVIFCLTFLALKYYNGGNLWSYVYDKFCDIFKTQNEMEKCINDKVLKKLKEEYNCKQNYYQIPVMNAIIPFNYAEDYIEFVNDIYTKNFECDISESNVEKEIENIFKSLKDDLNDKNDLLDINYDQDNKKTYKLITATKKIIKSGFKLNELILFTSAIIHKIDDVCNGKNLKTNDYIDEAFKVWYKDNTKLRSQNNERKSNGLRNSSAYFSLKDSTKIILHTPTIKKWGIFEKKLFSLQIYENEESIYQNNNLIIQTLLGQIKIQEEEYEIKNPFNKIRCKIFCKDEIIYDSKDSLFRDYLMFDDDNQELKNNTSYAGDVYFIYKENCDSRLNKIHEDEFFKIAYKDVSINDEYTLDSHKILFTDCTKSRIDGDKIIGLELIKNIPIYKNIKQIILVSDNLNETTNKIKINDNFINNTSNLVKTIKENSAIVYILDSKKMNFEPNLYKIELVDIAQNKTFAKYEFLYDPNIDIEQSILNNDEILFKYHGSFLILDENNENTNEFKLLINNLNEKEMHLKIDNELYNCNFSLILPYYQIDNKSINTFDKYITKEDFIIGSKLFFNIADCNKVTYNTDPNDKSKKLNIKTLLSKTYVDLSELKLFEQCDKITIQFFSNDIEKNCLFLYNNPVFDKAQSSAPTIYWQKEEIEFHTVIYGKKPSDAIFIRLENEDGILEEQELKDINIFKPENKVQKIHYRIYQKIKKTDGFKLIEEEKILDQNDFNYYPFKALMNKWLLIDQEIIWVSNSVRHIKLHIKLNEQINESTFLSYLMYENNLTKRVIVKLSPNIYTFYELGDDNNYLLLSCLDMTITNQNDNDKEKTIKYRINLTNTKELWKN